MADRLSAIDQIIQEAQQEGKFDDLAGKGKPLVLDMSPDAVFNGLLKEANVTPEWIQLAGAIDRLLEQGQRIVEAFAVDYAAAREAIAAPDAAHAATAAPSVPPEPPRPRWQRWLVTLLSRSTDRATPVPAADELQHEAMTDLRRRWERTLDPYAASLHAANDKIRRLNLIVPLTHRQRAPVPVAEHLEAFAVRFPLPARGEAGGLRWAPVPVPTSLFTPPPEDDETRAARRDRRQMAALLQARTSRRQPPPIG